MGRVWRRDPLNSSRLSSQQVTSFGGSFSRWPVQSSAMLDWRIPLILSSGRCLSGYWQTPLAISS